MKQTPHINYIQDVNIEEEQSSYLPDKTFLGETLEEWGLILREVVVPILFVVFLITISILDN